MEDVYSYNDFSHCGDNPGCKPRRSVTGENRKAFLISEHNGHMFPTKSFDPWEKRQEQALRHMRVLSAAAADGDHAGCFGWCMFDYQTHPDFGSGDRICYHGVMDAFRNPKTAAFAYASQGCTTPVLAVGSGMDIGDYPAGRIGPVAVFTNADQVSLYKNGRFVIKLKSSKLKGLPHPPLRLDDTIGDLLETEEGFPKAKADMVRSCLLIARNKGMDSLSPADRAQMGLVLMKYGMKFEDAAALYGKYVGNWGQKAVIWRLDAEKDGHVVKSLTCAPSARLRLEVTTSATSLHEGDTYDMAAVRIRVVDEFGNTASYAQIPVVFTIEGPARLVGPVAVTAEGGMCGTYVQTLGKPGNATLTIAAAQAGVTKVEFTID